MSSTDLTGRVALVTGAGSGLGQATARALTAAGCRVLAADLDRGAADETANAVVAAGGEAASHALDVTDHEQCEAAVAAAVERFGALHVLVNFAGVSLVGQDGFAPDATIEAWDRTIAVNLTGTFYCCRAAIPAMTTAGGGSIVNAASSMAHLPLGGMDAYAASKGGVAMLTRSLAPGCGARGIRVNALSPGYVDTPMTSVIFEAEALREAFDRGHATGMQTPEEIADLVVFLAGDGSRSLTGAVLTCDRGWSAFKVPDLLRDTIT